MKITNLETFITNAGLRNYLFVRLKTDTGLTGIGEASLEWQEKTVQVLLNEWVEDRVLGCNPFDVERIASDLIRDQYSGGSTVMTAISSIEVALWDIVGKAQGQPVWELLGGKCHDRMPSYANGWYGGARTPAEYAEKAKDVVANGYKAMKFDPFGIAWQDMTESQMEATEDIVAAIRNTVGDDIDLMIEVHGRLSVDCAIEMGKRLEKYNPAWYEEPVTPNSLDQLKEVRKALSIPIAAGERLYTIEDFQRLASIKAADVVQMDPSHCGGLLVSKKAAKMAAEQEMTVSPHCSIGPVALCAALHFDFSTPNVHVQENFAEYDVPWRNDLVCGWDPIEDGEFILPEGPGLGIEINTQECDKHPYQKGSFPSLWDEKWIRDFTQKDKDNRS